MPSRSILLIEEDRSLAAAISALLEGESYSVDAASDGESGFFKVLEGKSALVILNAVLSNKTGFEICRELRQAGVDTAILMLAADCVQSLKLGADDCLAVPFDSGELLARVAALLRRVEKDHRIPILTFRFDDVEMDFVRSEVRKAGQQVSLAAKELQLIHYLVEHRDRVVPRKEILQNVWQYNGQVSSRTLDVHISWLRQKLDNPRGPQHIQTIRGKGYRFTASPA